MFTKVQSNIYRLWNERPLALIMLSGLLFRLIAAVFSKGYGMHDDHFLVIEAAQSWVDKYDYNNWLPKDGQTTPTPSGHSFFYPGLHYFLFRFLEFIKLTDPQGKMYVVRVLHALYSMITVYFGYKITLKLAGEKIAKQAGIILSVFWIFPFLSVRNLVEAACIPPLVFATWLAIKDEKPKLMNYLFIGLLLGIGFNFRFQSLFFTGGFGLALLFQKKIIPAIITGFGFLVCALAFQGICDYTIWHQPFVEFQEYVRYNIANSTTYFNQPWYNYMLLLAGILIPPISLFLLFGFFKNYKKHLLIFLPSFIFLAFHSYFPNKQERFILPIFPFIIILGTIGWSEFAAQSKFWQGKQKLLKGCWIFFWTLNTTLLLVVSFAYSKRNRVEAMCYLSSKNDIGTELMIDDSNRGGVNMSPMFYLHKWVKDMAVTNETNVDELCKNLSQQPYEQRPHYVLFYQTENLEKRKAVYEKYFHLKYETTVEPSFIDNFMYKLNPANVNCTTTIYRIETVKPE